MTDTRKFLAIAVLPWVAARAAVLAGWAAADTISDRISSSRPVPLLQGFLAWDGTFYEQIARVGYQGDLVDRIRYFPLYPILGKVLSVLTGGSEEAALVIIANASSLYAGWLLYRLVKAETGDEDAARRAVWYLAMYPVGFVFVLAYSEGLMLTLGLGAILAARDRRWELAAALGLAAGLTRPTALAIVPIVGMYAWRRWKPAGKKERVRSSIAATAPVLGLASFLVWAGIRYSDASAPFDAHRPLRGDFVDPFSRTAEALGDMIDGGAFGDRLHLPAIVAFVVLTVVTFRRLPLGYGFAAAGVMVVALSSENLTSLERYGLSAFPLLMSLALVTRADWLDRAALTISATGLATLTALSMSGQYVP
jgi:hypothetical protein